MRSILRIKVCEIPRRSYEINGPDNNEGDGNTCLWTVTILKQFCCCDYFAENYLHLILSHGSYPDIYSSKK